MAGRGKYAWVGTDGHIYRGDNWDDLPEEMDRVIEFVPDYPDPPHTVEDHEVMEQFQSRLHDALSRCLR